MSDNKLDTAIKEVWGSVLTPIHMDEELKVHFEESDIHFLETVGLPDMTHKPSLKSFELKITTENLLEALGRQFVRIAKVGDFEHLGVETSSRELLVVNTATGYEDYPGFYPIKFANSSIRHFIGFWSVYAQYKRKLIEIYQYAYGDDNSLTPKAKVNDQEKRELNEKIQLIVQSLWRELKDIDPPALGNPKWDGDACYWPLFVAELEDGIII